MERQRSLRAIDCFAFLVDYDERGKANSLEMGKWVILYKLCEGLDGGVVQKFF